MRTILSWVAVLAAVAGAILVTSGPAGAAGAAARPARGNAAVVATRAAQQTVTNYSLSGNETAVSCLTASLCVAVGSRGLVTMHGAVVTLTNGQQSHAKVLRASSVIDSVSCRKSGCWAIGVPVHGAGIYLVKISSAGRPVAERTVKLPAGTSLGPISCASMTSCEIAGDDNRIRPAAIEIGDWNGRKLHLHRVTVKGSKQVSMFAISCWHSDCEAVGAGLILTTAGGKPAKLNAHSGYSIGSISCVSAMTCYGTTAGVVTVTRGVVTNSQATAIGVNTIECNGTTECEAGGWFAVGSGSWGFLQSVSDGIPGASINDGASSGYTGMAPRGGNGGFIAIGTGSNIDLSEVTVG